MKKRIAQENGQTMILITVMMGGLILSATAIAGLLMFYQLQRSTDAASSGRAIFAADAASEQALECYFHELVLDSVPNTTTDYCLKSVTLGNGAEGSAVIRFDILGQNVIGFWIRGNGIAGSTERGLESYFSVVQ